MQAFLEQPWAFHNKHKALPPLAKTLVPLEQFTCQWNSNYLKGLMDILKFPSRVWQEVAKCYREDAYSPGNSKVLDGL